MPMSVAKPPAKTPPPADGRAPVMRVTRYDVVLSFLIALVIGVLLAVMWLSVVWASNRLGDTERTAEMEFVELSGGVSDGAVDETLRVDSPEDVTDDPSVSETPTENAEIEETFENVMELADQAVQQVQQQYETDSASTGPSGRAEGTGRRALGEGPGTGGLPREQRWFVRFGEKGTLTEYARQIDFFGIELGALLPGGKMLYLSNVNSEKPITRQASSGAGESRLYMTWQGGERSKADFDLFERAGFNVRGAILFHFYPPETEQMLARLEREYRNRPIEDIRRTYFIVRRVGSAFQYAFELTRQSYFR